jgi:formylglycine-generating enzyme required for sulfatase activity
MAEFQDSRRPRPTGQKPKPNETYDLADEEPEPLTTPALPDEDESEEPDEAPRSAPAPPPLPRLWKAEPEPSAGPVLQPSKTPSPDEAATVKPAARKKAPPVGPDGQRKGVLIEETPELDTYEARQKARILVGAAMLGIVLLGGVFLYRVLAPRGDEEVAPAPMVAHQAIAPVAAKVANKEQNEREARSLYDRAHDVAKGGDADLVVSLLAKVTKSYPDTAAAADAREALDRPNQNLPLFPDRPAVVARRVVPPEPVKTEPADPSPVVEATPVKPLPAGPGEASLVLPVNPAEPARPGQDSVALAPSPSAPDRPANPLPDGFRARPGAVVHASGWPLEIVGDRDGAPMVLIPGGTFLMGRDDGDPAERPSHRVTLATYYIDRHEVTVRQFDLFQREAGERPDRVRALARKGVAAAAAASEDSPVVMVSARDAQEYADWAGKRLPTEAQWEMAARGTDGRLHPWGSAPPNWEKKREPRQIDPILSFASDVSPFGVADMAANAWEWTKDWYDPRYYQQFKSIPAENPTGPTTKPRSLAHTVRGGAKNWSVTHREGIQFDTRLPYLGFRCVLPVEGPDNAFNPPPEPGQPAAPSAPKILTPF